MAWGDTFLVRIEDSQFTCYRCPYCKKKYPNFYSWGEFLKGHLAHCERDYRNG